MVSRQWQPLQSSQRHSRDRERHELFSTAQVRDKSLAQAWYNFDQADVERQQFAPHGLRGGIAKHGLRARVCGCGEWRFPSLVQPGNALDAGAERTFQRTIISPACDSLGTPRPQGNGYDVGAFESMGAAYAVVHLNQDFTTSAGVYKPDGTLVKTLFSARRLFAGTNVVFWNGLDDNNQIAPAGTYTIKMIAHNVQYVWENVVGNSSVPNCGESVHNGFEPIKAMTFNGTTAFYTSGYNENHFELNRFDTSNPNKLTKIFGPKTLITTDSITDVAADGSNLYAMNSNDRERLQPEQFECDSHHQHRRRQLARRSADAMATCSSSQRNRRTRS